MAQENNLRQFIASLTEDSELSQEITFHRLLPGSEADYGQTLRPLSNAVARLLGKRQLYSHQSLAIDHIRAGHSIIVSTPTASGKSLIYNLPVYEKFLHDPEATALYIYPLKALAQDQLAAFSKLGENWPAEARPYAALYDGDTTDWERRKIRANPPTALMTNPEMLHLSLLPHHESWTTFLANLSIIVVDEAHTFRGIFGSHMAQVFRRLNRICRRYGARPSYVFCSATLGNPGELASSLAGEDISPALVDKSGAPQGSRHFIFINPLKSTATRAIDLLKRALEAGLRTIVYCQSRRMTELVSMWAASGAGEWKNRISAYRAGFLPEERREIESRMASGDLRAVVSTSALELGIDIGGLDLCILAGYPGTIMQTLQRGGRVGRAGQESAVIIIGGDDALDQYFMRNPTEFFTRPPEKAVVNPYNNVIMARHLECAAAEMPLEKGEELLAQPEACRALDDLQKKGLLLADSENRRWHAKRRQPQRQVDLRGSGQTYSIENEEGKIIGTIDGFRAWKETHPGAVYIHHGKSYIINSLESGRMRIAAQAKTVKWHTRARCAKTTEILEINGRLPLDNCVILHAKLRITEKITGYEKRSNDAGRLLSISPLDVPPHVYETDGMCIVFPEGLRQRLEARFTHFMGSIHALEHAMIGLMPLEVLADRNDFGGISIPLHPQLGHAAVFVYDALPGGAGLVASAWRNARSLLENTRKRVSECDCDEGCPSCIHSPRCGAGNRPLSKQGLLDLLQEVLSDGNLGHALADTLEILPPDPEPVSVEDPHKAAPPAKQRIKTCIPAPPGLEQFYSENFPPQANSNGRHDEESAVYSRIEIINERSQIEKKSQSALKEEEILEESSRFEPSSRAYVVFDVETRLGARDVGGWQNASQMGISIAVLYDSRDNTWNAYQEDELSAMFHRMASADLVIGFNNLRFDNLVLAPFAAKTRLPNGEIIDLAKLPNMDLLERIRKTSGLRISLDNLAGATLGSGKSANGLLALKWWKEGNIGKITEYCRMDVKLTRDLYRYGLKEKYLFYTNSAGKKTRINVDFS